jgi:hypothetical protein
MKQGTHPNSLKNLKPCRKGEIRNPNGKPALPDLKQLIVETGDITVAMTMLHKQAAKGNVKAIQELFDRGYGKPNQTVETKNVNIDINPADNLPADKLKAIREILSDTATNDNKGGEPMH